MATASKVQFTRGERPEFYVPGWSADAAHKTSVLLQENHERHHIFFNTDGFHNHIAHHLCTLYALGASPHAIQQQYDLNAEHQRPPEPIDAPVISELHDPARFKTYLGNERYYNDFLHFFKQEMDKKGWQAVLNEYLFSRDERADDMLVRMYAGFLHPIIHLGFGVEFHQPAIMAEALAQAAVHDNWMAPLLLGAERAAAALPSTQPSATLVDLLDKVRATPQLRAAAAATSNNRLRDGIIAREADAMVAIAAEYHVPASELEAKTAEMTNAAAYFTGAAQRRDKVVKMDFFYMHCINASIFFSAFLKQDWLRVEDKVRLLEWKGRNDLAMYASRGSPELLLDEIVGYEPKLPTSRKGSGEDDSWRDIITRGCKYKDDGHGAKLIRAFAHGQKICEPYEGREEFRIKHDMWLQLGHMAIDSVEGDEPEWVRGCGFDSAWEKVQDRPRAQL